MNKMNLYNLTTSQQRKDLKEVEVTIIEGKDYNKDETDKIYNTLTSYIFNKSKFDIPLELNRFMATLNILQRKK